MTERHMGYIVHLAQDIREDEAEATITALKMIKHVSTVTPVTTDYEADVIAVRRRDQQWQGQVLSLLGDMQHIPADGRQRESL